MARTVEGWKHFRDKRTGKYFVRFRHEGRRHNVATGETDSGAAAEAAARIYAEVISGRWREGKGLGEIGAPGLPFTEVAARWLADVESCLVPTTFTLYRQTYVKKHFAPFFVTMDSLTTVSVEDYVSKRLRQVKRQTLKAELSVLRRIAKWATKRGFLQRMPEIEVPGRRTLGTTASKSRKIAYQVFNAEEIDGILAELPEIGAGEQSSKGQNPISGSRALHRRMGDGAAAGNAQPTAIAGALPPRAGGPGYRERCRQGAVRPRAAARHRLACRARSVCPQVGIIFGEHDYRRLLREAATRAGIERHRAETGSATTTSVTHGSRTLAR